MRILLYLSSNYTCCICGKKHSASSGPESVRVPSNVRQYAQEHFTLWRCGGCKSIHSRDKVDLDRYYRHYPFFTQTLDAPLRWGYRRLVRRLSRAGLRRDHHILDYGCGSGLLVSYMKKKGYNATGYDPYSSDHGDPTALDKQYDWVIAQDVVEHAEDPLEILNILGALTRPGGIIVIGTPNAAGIDLTRANDYICPLHQPYHRHIFSVEALRQSGEGLSWSLRKYHSTPYTNMPILSLPFLQHYMRCFDNTLDVLFQRPLNSWKLWLHPRTLFLLLFGYFLCDDADIVAIFQTADA